MENKNKVLTIPNILSCIRILLVPMIVWAYMGLKNNYVALALIMLSGLTDILDGTIARKFNMISDVGKILDPIADKLTQIAIIICFSFKYKMMIILGALFVLKEIVMGILGIVSIKKIGKVNSAKWYGKVNTCILYVVMGVLILFPSISLTVANVMIAGCILSLLSSFFLYIKYYLHIWRVHPQNNGDEAL